MKETRGWGQHSTWSVVVLAFLIGVFSSCLQGCGTDPFEDVAQSNATAGVGTASNSFLSADTYKDLIIEFAYVDGFEPPSQAIDYLVSFLKFHLNKPDGIRIVIDAPLPRTMHSPISLDDIRFMEKNYRRYYNDGQTAAAFFLVLDQPYYVDNARMQTFGLAFNASAMALFEPPIKDMIHSNPLLTREALESTVLVHEFGHLLGLVNMGTPMVVDHADKTHGSRGHCNNPKCLMYYAVNTTLSYNIEGGRAYEVPQLDLNCLLDLRRAGGR